MELNHTYKNHQLVIAALLSLFACSGLTAQENIVATSQVTQARSTTKSKDDEIRKILAQDVTFDYEETPFVDVMDEIRAEYGMNIILDQSAQDDSLTEDELVTFKARGIQMKNALQLLLDNFNATFLVKHGVLMIISKDVSGDPEFFVRKIIDCQALLEKIKNASTNDPNQVNNVKTVPASTERRFSRRNVTLERGDKIDGLVDKNGRANQEELAETWFLVQRGQEDPRDLLIQLIKTSVAPHDWDDTNGDGSLMITSGCLVIQQSESIIQQVEQLVEELSTAMDGQ